MTNDIPKFKAHAPNYTSNLSIFLNILIFSTIQTNIQKNISLDRAQILSFQYRRTTRRDQNFFEITEEYPSGMMKNTFSEAIRDIKMEH